MVFMPPRHGKSELASRRFPAWYLGRRPDRQVIAASYGQDLARDFGRDVRNCVASPEYAALFPEVSLAEDSQAADRWHTKQGGMYVAAGIGTAITGRGAHLLLIDDPVKDRESADSEVIRKSTWEWFNGVAYTRLMPKGAIVVIQTRWHEDDLSGRILERAKATGDKWTVLDLPAIGDDGAALWPEWYPIESLERIRAQLDTREWSALYQQRPVPPEGAYFKTEWLRTYDRAPKDMRLYGASDYAVTANGGDYTVHIVAFEGPDKGIYIKDLYRARTTPDQWIAALVDMIREHRPLEWAEETGQINSAVGPYIVKALKEANVWTSRKPFASKHDKAVRAQSIRGKIAQHGLWLPANAPWRKDLEAELLTFPTGRHDDQVDALGLIGQLLDKMGGAKRWEPIVYPKSGLM